MAIWFCGGNKQTNKKVITVLVTTQVLARCNSVTFPHLLFLSEALCLLMLYRQPTAQVLGAWIVRFCLWLFLLEV